MGYYDKLTGKYLNKAAKPHHIRVYPGLVARQANYLTDVPAKLRPGYTKPGSQNRKKGISKRVALKNA